MQELYGFDKLIAEYIEGKLDINEFEKKYLKKYLEDNDPISEELYQILDSLFVYVHGYTDDPELVAEEPNFSFNKDQVYKKAQETLNKIRTLE